MDGSDGHRAAPGITAMTSSAGNAASAQPVVLLADDEQALTEELGDYLGHYGFEVLIANSFTDMLAVLQHRPVDIIVLDQRFGAVDTLPMLPQIRGLTDAPIMMYTGNREEADRVVGLELGADDFLLKPISGRELVARLRARLRRPPAMPAAAAPPPPRGTWRIAPAERRVTRPDGSVLRLTTAEFDLLAALSGSQGEVCTREELTRSVFRRDWRPGDRAVDNAVLHLRQKLASEGFGEGCIVTVRQLGYVFAGFPDA